jgi:hypothetical protein
MLLSTKLTIAAVVLLGAISIAQAAEDRNYNTGGYDVGPLGQCFDPAACGYGRRGGAYAYAYSRHYTPGYGWHYGLPR